MRPIYWDPRLHTGTDDYGVPSTDDLMLVPEMASVHLLHQAVAVAIRALRMVEDAPPRRLATHALAMGIIALLHALDTLLADYRGACCDDLQAIADRDRYDDEPPF
jgi:hypothetical protein